MTSSHSKQLKKFDGDVNNNKVYLVITDDFYPFSTCYNKVRCILIVTYFKKIRIPEEWSG